MNYFVEIMDDLYMVDLWTFQVFMSCFLALNHEKSLVTGRLSEFGSPHNSDVKQQENSPKQKRPIGGPSFVVMAHHHGYFRLPSVTKQFIGFLPIFCFTSR